MIRALIRDARAATARAGLTFIALMAMAWPLAIPAAPFRIEDSISLKHIVPIGPGGMASGGEIAAVSPDGRQVLVHTQYGDLSTDELIDMVWVTEVPALTSNSPKAAPPAMRPLVTHAAKDENATLADLTWLSSERIGYTLVDAARVRQAYARNLVTKSTQPLTASGTDVTRFSATGDSIIYYAKDEIEEAVAYDIARYDIGELLAPAAIEKEYPQVSLFVSYRGAAAQRVPAPQMRIWPGFQGLWISTTGRYAIALEPATAWPSHWQEYRAINQDAHEFTPARATSAATSIEVINRLRFRWVDLQRATSRPLLDAPTGVLSNSTMPSALWSEDEKTVVLVNTFLPLPGVSAAERARRAAEPAIVAIDPNTGEAWPIRWLPRDAPRLRKAVIQAQRLNLEFETHSGQTLRESHSLIRGPSMPERQSQAIQPRSVEFAVREGLNQPPVIVAKSQTCGCERLFFDPNPQLARLKIAKAEPFNWTDGNGIQWRGSVTFPLSFQAGRKYPLVVQTHGFVPDEWLVDGPDDVTTAFAAQAIAAAGMFVLQIADNPAAQTQDIREAPLNAEGYRAGIQALIDKGYADPVRVGIIGWSITGSYVTQLLAGHPQLIAAAVISDAAQFGYLMQLLTVNGAPQMRAMSGQYTGGPITAERLADWVKEDPQYKLARLNPMIRLEAITAGSLVGMWELYALLRMADQPVDFVYLPHGSHSLRMPRQRLASQGGAVDWFLFWLIGVEDEASKEADQYARWRSMRRQQCARAKDGAAPWYCSLDRDVAKDALLTD